MREQELEVKACLTVRVRNEGILILTPDLVIPFSIIKNIQGACGVQAHPVTACVGEIYFCRERLFCSAMTQAWGLGAQIGMIQAGEEGGRGGVLQLHSLTQQRETFLAHANVSLPPHVVTSARPALEMVL